MPDLADGQTVEMKGSARLPYILKNVGGVYSCTCPAWRNQSIPIELRSCKHLRQYRGKEAEEQRVGQGTRTTSSNSSTVAESEGAAVPLLLAHAWDNDQDLTGWWISEKLDGVRAYWDGQKFLSRQGNQFHAPEWFAAGLPSFPLDGELWIDRKAFQRTVSIVRRQDGGEQWKVLKYVVFDAPSAGGRFEERMEVLNDVLTPGRSAFAVAHLQTLCRGLDDLRQRLAEVESVGGEGVMLRQPASLYEAGRSPTLLKVKTFHDAEARVVEHLAGAGRHMGRLGALLVELPDGTRFSVGTGFSDAQRGNAPPVGSTITFRYQELTNGGVPRFPSFVRVRSDG
jgi:DNA ligase-1